MNVPEYLRRLLILTPHLTITMQTIRLLNYLRPSVNGSNLTIHAIRFYSKDTTTTNNIVKGQPVTKEAPPSPKAKSSKNSKSGASTPENKKNGQTPQKPTPKPVEEFKPKQFDYNFASFYDILSDVDHLRLPQPSNKQPLISNK